MIVLLSIETIPAVLSVVTAALLMIITGCVRSMEEAYQKINWEPVLINSSDIRNHASSRQYRWGKIN